ARMRTTGEAVFVDVSAQAALTWTMLNAMTAEPIQGYEFQRDGASLDIGPTKFHLVHACRDGYVTTLCGGRITTAIQDWLLASGVIDPDWLAREDWRSYDYRVFRGGEFAIPFPELVETLRRFFRTKTKEELFLPALAKGYTIAPVMTLDEMLAFEQLAARDYWRETPLANGARVRAPGPFARPSQTPLPPVRPAPRLG